MGLSSDEEPTVKRLPRSVLALLRAQRKASGEPASNALPAYPGDLTETQPLPPEVLAAAAKRRRQETQTALEIPHRASDWPSFVRMLVDPTAAPGAMGAPADTRPVMPFMAAVAPGLAAPSAAAPAPPPLHPPPRSDEYLPGGNPAARPDALAASPVPRAAPPPPVAPARTAVSPWAPGVLVPARPRAVSEPALDSYDPGAVPKPPLLGPLPVEPATPNAPESAAPLAPAAEPPPSERAVDEPVPELDSLAIYAHVRVAMWDQQLGIDPALARYAVAPSRWTRIADEIEQGIAAETDTGRVDLAMRLSQAIAAVRGERGAPKRLTTEQYATIRAAIDRAPDEAAVLQRCALSDAEWRKHSDDWKQRAEADDPTRKRVEVALVQARARLDSFEPESQGR